MRSKQIGLGILIGLSLVLVACGDDDDGGSDDDGIDDDLTDDDAGDDDTHQDDDTTTDDDTIADDDSGPDDDTEAEIGGYVILQIVANAGAGRSVGRSVPTSSISAIANASFYEPFDDPFWPSFPEVGTCRVHTKIETWGEGIPGMGAGAYYNAGAAVALQTKKSSINLMRGVAGPVVTYANHYIDQRDLHYGSSYDIAAGGGESSPIKPNPEKIQNVGGFAKTSFLRRNS